MLSAHFSAQSSVAAFESNEIALGESDEEFRNRKLDSQWLQLIHGVFRMGGLQ